MRKVCLFTMIFLMLLLCGCEKQEDVEYVQRLLPEPASIVVSLSSTELTYEPGCEEYQLLMDALSPNWWKTMGEDGLTDAASVNDLRTSSTEVYRQNDETFVEFMYPDAIQWTQDDGSSLDIRMIVFRIPRAKEASEPVEGCFLISKTDSYLDTEGLYTYYYPAELANGFWDYLLH